MKIGIIGAGDVGRTLAGLWVKAGHAVMLSARRPLDVTALSEQVGAEVQAGTAAEAAAFGEVVFLAVNYWTLDEAVSAIGEGAAGKLVIDATNPLRYAEGGGTERVIADDALAADVTAAKLPRSRIAKAFTTMWTKYLTENAHRADPKAAVAFAASAADRAVVSQLIVNAGFDPVLLGDLDASRPLDPPSSIWNKVLTADQVRSQVSAEAPPEGR